MQALDTQGTFRPSLSMLGWALNEEENIGWYIERAEVFLRSLTDDFELILIDDGSTDRTWSIATSYQATRPWLRLYSNGSNRGCGFSIKQSVSQAKKDYLFWQTVDWSYDLGRLGEFLPWLKRDVILQGVRLNARSGRGILKLRSDNPWKGFVSIVNYSLIRLLFRLPLGDYQNVTIYPRKLIQSVTLETSSAFTNPECLLKTWWKGACFKEFPVPFLKRKLGQAKGTRLRSIWASVKDILTWWMRWIVLGKRLDRGYGTVLRWNSEMPAVPALAEAPAWQQNRSA
jgi:glycosyltransferase involved in cell wall biosynthesis